MKTTTRMAAAAATLLALGAADARAQLIELPATGSAAGDLTAHQIRVVQLALRDRQCYEGPINGRWTAATRSALQCARQRTGAADGMALSRELALWTAEQMTGRTMAGDVEPAAAPAAPSAPAPAMAPAPAPRPAPAPMPAMRDSSMMMRDTSMMMRDTSMMMNRDTTMGAMPARPRAMPMTPTDPLSPMSRSGATTADSLQAARMRNADMPAGTPADADGAMLVARVDSVIDAAEAGLTSLPPAQAAMLLDNIAMQLDAAGSPPLAAIAGDLRTLRTQLTATPFDAMQVGRSLTTVSDKVETAAAGLTGDAQTKLMRLANLLERSGRQLAPR